MLRIPQLRNFLFAAATTTCAASCVGIVEDGTTDPLGETRIAVETVPGDVRCIRTVAHGDGPVVARNFTVAPGASDAELELGRLPIGLVSIEGFAYPATCPEAEAPPVEEPTWIADRVEVDVFSGIPTDVHLVFRPHDPATGSADFVDAVAKVATGGYTTYALMYDGTVRSWGWHFYGLLGTGTIGGEHLRPEPIPGLVGVVDIDAGRFHACALLEDGTVRCWGRNDRGQLGDGTTANRWAPVEVSGLTNVTAISAGGQHTCAMRADETAWCWGYNGYGQIGNGTKGDRTVPFRSQLEVTAVSAGYNHTCVLTRTGASKCAGYNGQGQVGIADFSPVVDSFTTVANLTATIEISAGANHTCGLRADGALYCWGNNTVGAVGDGTHVKRLAPVVTLARPDVIQVSTSGNNTYALHADGTVSSWGENQSGELGDGTGLAASTPVPALGLQEIIQVEGGWSNACAVTRDGKLFCWGYNAQGQAGNGTTTHQFVPVQVEM